MPANKRDMGMVFQAYSLFPHMTVIDNVAFGLKLRGSDSAATRASGPATCWTWSASASTPTATPTSSPAASSSASRWRGRWPIEPSVLLLDEPLSALDAKVRVQLRDEIRRVQLEVGTTTLFVTHDQEEALAVADRVGVMNAGRLEQLAPPAELYSAPATRFVGEFVGLSNRLPATVAGGVASVLGREVPALDGSAPGDGFALVRPEAVSVVADEGGHATVTTVMFLGPLSRVTCTLDDGTDVVAQLASSEALRLEPGDAGPADRRRGAGAGRGLRRQRQGVTRAVRSGASSCMQLGAEGHPVHAHHLQVLQRPGGAARARVGDDVDRTGQRVEEGLQRSRVRYADGVDAARTRLLARAAGGWRPRRPGPRTGPS